MWESRLFLESWIHSVAQADADEIKRERSEIDHETREKDVRPVGAIEAGRFIQHVSPRRRGNLNAEAEETDDCLGQDSPRNRE